MSTPTFTAQMEQRLDEVEEGKTYWKAVLREFYGGLRGRSSSRRRRTWTASASRCPTRCPRRCAPSAGGNLVIKSGRFGRFLACPGYPECDFTKPLVVEMPGKCPKCGGRILKRQTSQETGKQYTYYGCEHNQHRTRPPSATS